ncbi:MAG: 6,7-dimethyl-8-ribityllumazine synthase [Planctomycetota bacterium]|nr:MAG: 6,7-dimethyl-8-ribityllumazine synthase [Planctomycetota bacterium]
MIFEGLPNVLPPGTRVGIAVARWNEPITRRLLAGAVHRLEAAGLPAAAVDVAWVPGSFELPLAADRLAATGRYAAILCLGAIIKGETSHDHHIATATAAGIEATARGRGLPVIFGVLTCDTLAQAMVRAGGDAADGYAGNKGAECAAAAAEMVALLSQIVSAGGRS